MKTIAIIPCFNEEKTIGRIVSELKKKRIDTIVVDDDSTDDTGRVAEENGALVISHLENMGKGYSLKSAQEWLKEHKAKYDWIIIMDGDGQYDTRDIPKFEKHFNDLDAGYLIGQRDWRTVPFRHALGNRLIDLVFLWAYGIPMDVCCGFIAIRKEIFEQLKPKEGYIVDVDMIAQKLKMRSRIATLGFRKIPVRVTYRKVRGIASGCRMVAGIVSWILWNGLE